MGAYQARVKFWDANEKSFYEYLHSWYEDSDLGACCVSTLQKESMQQRMEGFENIPHIKYFGRTSNKNIAWKYDNTDVKGIAASKILIYIKYDIKNTQARIDARHRIDNIIVKATKARPDLWQKNKETKGFAVAGYFLNTDRDEHMLDYLLHHLYMVAGATVGSCVLFLHPFYGLAVGIFMALINLQILGLLAIFGISLDIISFGVIVMAIGFEIEYVLHIAHAFLHCKGKGLQRTMFAIEEMGLTVCMAFMSTAVQQIVLLGLASSLAFSLYPVVMLIVIIKAGITGFVTVPGVLGIISYLNCFGNKYCDDEVSSPKKHLKV